MKKTEGLERIGTELMHCNQKRMALRSEHEHCALRIANLKAEMFLIEKRICELDAMISKLRMKPGKAKARRRG